MPPCHGDQAGTRTAKLSADIASVCEELQLPSSVAAALAAAAAKGHISGNPGVLLPQVRSWCMIKAVLASRHLCFDYALIGYGACVRGIEKVSWSALHTTRWAQLKTSINHYALCPTTISTTVMP